MLSSDFEKAIQQQMGELRFPPDDAVWNNVEAALPGNRRRRRFVLFLLFCGLLTGSSYMLRDIAIPKAGNSLHGEKNGITADEKSSVTINDKKEDPATASNTPADDEKKPVTVAGKESRIAATVNNPAKRSFNANGRVAVARMVMKEKAQAISQEQRAINTPGKQATGKESIQDTFSKTIPGEQVTGSNETADHTTVNAVIQAPSVAISPAPAKEITTTEIKKEDSIKTVTPTPGIITKPPANKTAKNKTGWRFGIHLSGGISNTKNSVFGSNMVYYDPATSGSGGMGGFTNPASNPTRSFAYMAGVYAERNISRHWALQAGLQYAFYSTGIRVGEKVDSVLNVNFSTFQLKADNYYRNAVAGSEKYSNHYQYLQLPLMLQYRFVHFPLLLEAGPSLSYLLQSNALLFNNTGNAWYNSRSSFNKWLFGINGGLAYSFAKSKRLPVTAGLRYSFSVSSATKKTFGNQHISSPQLYLHIPLKK